MEELVIDKNYKIFGETFGVMSFDDFLDCIEDISSNNSIMPVSKNRYLVKFNNQDYYLSTDYLDVIRFAPESKYKEYTKRLKKACKLSKTTSEVKEYYGLTKIEKDKIKELLDNNNAIESKITSDVVRSSFHSLLRIVEMALFVGALPGAIALVFLTKSIMAMIAAVIIVPLIVYIGFFVQEFGTYGLEWHDVIEPFKDLIEYSGEKRKYARKRKILKNISKRIPDVKQLDKPKEVKQLNDSAPQINVDSKIDFIMQKAKELNTSDKKAILEELKPIVERYAKEISSLKPGLNYKNVVADISNELAQDLSHIEDKVLLLIRRNNLEQAIKNYSDYEKTEENKEEVGPTRRLTPQN